MRDALLNGRGGDHPVGAESVAVRRLGPRTLLHLSSRDPLVVAPSPGSRNDPRHPEFGGARVELRLAGAEIRTIELSRADRFAVHRGSTVYLGSLFGGGEPVWLRLDEGDGLDLLLGDAPITPSEAAAGFSVTITLGTLRTYISVPPSRSRPRRTAHSPKTYPSRRAGAAMPSAATSARATASPRTSSASRSRR